MDIFISYRRGGPDAPTAGRIYDYLKSLGYHSYYDKDGKVNPIGEQFPGTIDKALQSCKVVIAVIGDSWRAQSARLAEKDDWVRHELLSASPDEKRNLIPIHISPPSQKIELALPPGLEFVGTAHGFIWEGVEDAEKTLLREKLEVLLPDVRTTSKIVDNDRLELLCDRVFAADGFEDALDRREPEDKKPGCWILFGEQGEGQEAIFARIKAYTLDSDDYKVRYPSRQMYPLFLDEYYGVPEEEIRKQVIERVAGGRKIESYESLYAHLSKQNIALGVLCSVVHVETVNAAKWWMEQFVQLREQFPAMRAEGPQIVLALSISYAETKRAAWLSLFRKRNEIRDFFQSRYPHLFAPEDEAAWSATSKRASPTVRRLHPVREKHVRRWCEHRDVRPRIEGVSLKEFIAQFTGQPERPMEDVMETLQGKLRQGAGRNDK